MALDDLTTTVGIVALAAAGLALLTLLVAIVLAVKLRRVRIAQRVVLGGHERRDLVSHAERLEAAFVQLRDWVEDSLGRLDGQSANQDARIADCVAHTAVVRYDAYGELSGQQSSSLALLDAHGSGVVVSSIVHRDQARVYVKEVREGGSDLQLSPEEQQAIKESLDGSRAPDGRGPDGRGQVEARAASGQRQSA